MESNNLSTIYADYGELMIQQEIMSARINEVKKKIAEELNNPAKQVEATKE